MSLVIERLADGVDAEHRRAGFAAPLGERVGGRVGVSA